MLRPILFCFLLNFLLPSYNIYAQCTFTSSVPYFESFSSLTANNQLPTCWSTPNIGSTSLTYTNSTNAFSGGSCASFYHSPAGTRNFYSNGIQLYAGVIYSVNVFYKTDNAGEQIGANYNWVLALHKQLTALPLLPWCHLRILLFIRLLLQPLVLLILDCITSPLRLLSFLVHLNNCILTM